MSASASATLGTFGFSGDASHATHFVYRLRTEKRASVIDTSEYEACCAEKGGCGYGFVSALVYGSGEYATGEETSGTGEASVAFTKAGGSASLKLLHRRAVRGWVAAMIRVTDQTKAPGSIGTLGDPKALGIDLNEESLPDQVKQRYEVEKISIADGVGDRLETAYVLSDGNGLISENEFARRYHDVTGSAELEPVHGRRTTRGLLVWGGLTLASSAVFGWGLMNLQRRCNVNDTFVYNGGAGLDERIYGESGGLSSGEVVREDCLGRAGAPGHVEIDPIPSEPSKYNYRYVDPNKETTNVLGVAATVIGGIGLATFGSLFVWKLSDYDGSPSDHRITKADAKLYVAQYNRALLRRTVRDTESRMRRLSGSLRLRTVQPIVAPTFLGLTGSFD